MSRKVLLDPEVVLNPTSFALHIIAFSSCEMSLRIPVGWLWEELNQRYTVLEIADILNWHTDNVEASMREPLVSDTFYSLHATAALLVTCQESGYLEFIATSDYGAFFKTRGIGNWSNYLTDLINNKWIDIELSESSRKFSEQAALSIASKRTGLDTKAILDIYLRNQDWMTRNPEEYGTYELVRVLMTEIDQLCACLEGGHSVSTSNENIKKLINEIPNEEGQVFIPGGDNSMLPILKKVKFKPEIFTVGDILNLADSRATLRKLGDIEILLDTIREKEYKNELRKDAILYLLGLFPATGAIANILGAISLSESASKIFQKIDPMESILYFDADEWNFQSNSLFPKTIIEQDD